MSDQGRRTRATSDGLRYPFANVPGPGVLTQVTPGVYWLRMPLPLRLNHVNVWLLAEPGGGEQDLPPLRAVPSARTQVVPSSFAVVDTGLGDEVTRDLWDKVLAQMVGEGSATALLESGSVVSRIILTHFHPDHSGAAGWLASRTGARLLMSRGEHERALASMREEPGGGAWSAVERLDPHGLPEAVRKVLLAPGKPFGALVPDVPDQYMPLSEGQAVVLGGRPWQVILGYGHSPEHVSLYSQAPAKDGGKKETAGEYEGILISGDMLLPHISSHVGSPVTWALGNPVALFVRSLRRFAELPENTLVLPGHGVPFVGMRARVAALLEHHQERCARMLAAVDAPKTAGDLLEVLFPRSLDSLQVILAMNETIAHLAYLAEQGAVERVDGVDGKVRWVRAKL